MHVWCGILGNQVIGPIFFEGNLTGNRYLHFLNNEIEAYLDQLPIRQYIELIWQQDGAPLHNIQPVTNFLNDRYGLWIGRQGTIRWPANSPDLTPLDNFLWGYLKNKVYFERTENLDILRNKIVNEIFILNNNFPIFTGNAVNKLREVFQNCLDNGGGHVNL